METCFEAWNQVFPKSFSDSMTVLLFLRFLQMMHCVATSLPSVENAKQRTEGCDGFSNISTNSGTIILITSLILMPIRAVLTFFFLLLFACLLYLLLAFACSVWERRENILFYCCYSYFILLCSSMGSYLSLKPYIFKIQFASDLLPFLSGCLANVT